MLGLYFHIPFCKTKCPYCNFYSVNMEKNKKSAFCEALVKEINKYDGLNYCANSVYFGGGTPSILEPLDIKKILDTVKKIFKLAKNTEITIECNPSSLTREKIYMLKKFGVNRLSVGMQSAVSSELKFLGRKHTTAQTENVVKWAKEVGIENISVDFIFGLKNQKISDIKKTIDFIKKLDITHVSCYILKIEKGTIFGQKNIATPPDDYIADLYIFICNNLSKLGFEQYEISNFSKPNYRCIHNLKYWTLKNYIGFGPSAHSLLHGKRFYNKANLNSYIENSNIRKIENNKKITKDEWLMLNLRLTDGIQLTEAKSRGYDLKMLRKKFEKLQSAGYAKIKHDNFQLTPTGMLVQNAILLYLSNL